MNIEIIKDTNTIENNTADSLRVVISEQTPIVGDFKTNGTTIKGSGLVKIDSSFTTQGELKARLAEIGGQIHSLTSEQTEKQTLLGQVGLKIDEAIAEILASGGVDNRETK